MTGLWLAKPAGNEHFDDGQLTNMYGPTETTSWSLAHEVDATAVESVPIGRLLPNDTAPAARDGDTPRLGGSVGSDDNSVDRSRGP